MNGDDQMREDALDREMERQALIEMQDPEFLDDSGPEESIGEFVAWLACAIAFCLLLYAIMAIPE
jgi:hypothetical protein